jgi:hypothetical protein
VTRIVSANNATEAAKYAVTAAILADLDFSSGIVRVHDGSGTLSFGGNAYLGVGTFAGVDVVDENVDFVARGIKLTLSGVDSAFVTSTMDEVYQNRNVILYLGFVNNATGALIDTPETLWEGRMNQMSIKLSKGSAIIELTCEHRLRREPRIARYTDSDQKLSYEGDSFFDLLHSIRGFVSKWGAENIGYMYNGGVISGTGGK